MRGRHLEINASLLSQQRLPLVSTVYQGYGLTDKRTKQKLPWSVIVFKGSALAFFFIEAGAIQAYQAFDFASIFILDSRAAMAMEPKTSRIHRSMSLEARSESVRAIYGFKTGDEKESYHRTEWDTTLQKTGGDRNGGTGAEWCERQARAKQVARTSIPRQRNP